MLINYSCSSITAKQLLVELSRKKVNAAIYRVHVITVCLGSHIKSFEKESVHDWTEYLLDHELG